MNAISEANTLRCLMENIDGPDMTSECEKHLMDIQYFMARDWTLDSEIYNNCYSEAIER